MTVLLVWAPLFFLYTDGYYLPNRKWVLTHLYIWLMQVLVFQLIPYCVMYTWQVPFYCFECTNRWANSGNYVYYFPLNWSNSNTFIYPIFQMFIYFFALKVVSQSLSLSRSFNAQAQTALQAHRNCSEGPAQWSKTIYKQKRYSDSHKAKSRSCRGQRHIDLDSLGSVVLDLMAVRRRRSNR